MENKILAAMGEAPLSENREFLVKALTAAMRWYATSQHLREGDNDHAVTIMDIVEALIE